MLYSATESFSSKTSNSTTQRHLNNAHKIRVLIPLKGIGTLLKKICKYKFHIFLGQKKEF
jgi:hypothetical protein